MLELGGAASLTRSAFLRKHGSPRARAAEASVQILPSTFRAHLLMAPFAMAPRSFAALAMAPRHGVKALRHPWCQGGRAVTEELCAGLQFSLHVHPLHVHHYVLYAYFCTKLLNTVNERTEIIGDAAGDCQCEAAGLLQCWLASIIIASQHVRGACCMQMSRCPEDAEGLVVPNGPQPTQQVGPAY